MAIHKPEWWQYIGAKHGVRWGESRGGFTWHATDRNKGQPVRPPGDLETAIAKGDVHPSVVDELRAVEGSSKVTPIRGRDPRSLREQAMIEEMYRRCEEGMTGGKPPERGPAEVIEFDPGSGQHDL